MSSADILGDTKELDIKISSDPDKKTLTIRDTGIGMTRADLIANLGTVAKSGTSNFVEALSDGADMSLIGQFGVGFYSVYLVADKVRVVSKNNNDEQYIWESTADSQFTIVKDPRGNTLGRGSEITMFLKEDAHEFASQEKLQELIKRYSEFITFPISLYKKSTETVEVDDDADEDDEDDEDSETSTSEDGLEIEEADESGDDDEEKKPKTEQVTKWEWEVMNDQVALWSRDKDEISDEEYQKFFKTICKDPTDARSWIHFRAEGEVEFKSLLFIPSEALHHYDSYGDRKAGVRLYVRKVLIQEDFEDLLPKYLNFIQGVVDSDDLPLNVSRETLQQHKVLSVMAKKVVRKVLEMLRKLATGKSDDDSGDDDSESNDTAIAKNDPEHPYIKFWEQFGKSIKMGAIEDKHNQSKLAKLLRFKSSKSDGKYLSLEDYIASMPSWQKEIYYVAGESYESIKNSPFLEVATKKNVDVLFLYEVVDEYVVQNLIDFDGFKFQSLSKEGVKFGDEDENVVKQRLKLYKETFKPLTKYLKDLFAGKVSKVTVSQRVESTPCIIVTSKYGHTANMERIMKAQTFATGDTVSVMQGSRSLELNPRHPIVIELNRLVQESPDDDSTKDVAYLLYDTALISSGFQQNEPEAFSSRMYRSIGKNLNLSSMDLAEEVDVEEEEEAEDDSVKSSSSGDSDASAGHDEF